ncbi:hypothetical protein [Abyssisolibacter fermentans]|uniref:hypothetical protein n=1 Tax=Abyssisolibacter fermentans TaxID=1766203 RepID=UPI00082FAB56|nr:hypothetical protein [Abyssisolibacter fermentans]
MLPLIDEKIDLYQGLTEKFLYNSDINSIFILLSLYDLEENMSNIYPKYLGMKKIRTQIMRFLKNKNIENVKNIANYISFIIHEDVNRIELCFYIEGYKKGYNDIKWVNVLEKKALNTRTMDELYSSKYLFHVSQNYNIKQIKKQIKREIDYNAKKDSKLVEMMHIFVNKVIKKKLYNLNNHVNEQLKLCLESYDIVEEKYNLKEEDINIIYKNLYSMIMKNLKNIYKEAYWFGVNDRVLKRYI